MKLGDAKNKVHHEPCNYEAFLVLCLICCPGKDEADS